MRPLRVLQVTPRMQADVVHQILEWSADSIAAAMNLLPSAVLGIKDVSGCQTPQSMSFQCNHRLLMSFRASH